MYAAQRQRGLLRGSYPPLLCFLLIICVLFIGSTAAPFNLYPAISYADEPQLDWPSGQVFPHFCCLKALDVITVNGLAADQHTLFVTLQGLVNRRQPRIYVREVESESGVVSWLDQLHVPSHSIADPFSLLSKYRNEIHGLVVYDPAVPDTLNLATTIAGQKDGIVVSPALLASRMSAYHLPTLLDLREMHFSSRMAVYRYAYLHYWSGAEHRLIVGIGPRVVGTLRDYAIATKAMVVWLDPRDRLQATLLALFLRDMPPGSAYMGWWTSESVGTREASMYGIATYATDWSNNLTVFGGVRQTVHSIAKMQRPIVRKKIYVALFMSDGDNVQIDQHRLVKIWNDPNRGRVPIGWTISPGLIDLAPTILDYYQRTASANDELVSGPSGMGYLRPDVAPDYALDVYTRQSGQYLAAAGINVATLWEDTNVMPGTVGDAYARNTSLLGITTQNGEKVDVGKQKIYAGRLPVVSMNGAYLWNEQGLEETIRAASAGFRGKSARFIAVQASLNSRYISPTALYRVQQYFSRNKNIVFVRPGQFFELYKASHRH